MPLGAAFIQETTIFREFGPLSGSTMRLAYDVSPKIGRPAVASDVRRRCALLPAARLDRRAGDAGQGLPQLRRLPRLPVLRRQRRSARLRLSAVRRAEHRAGERRAALPADRSGADADRRDRRHPRRVLRRHRRRVVQQLVGGQSVHRRGERRSSSRPTRRRSARCRPATRSTRSATSRRPINPATGQPIAGAELHRRRRCPASACRTAAPRTASASKRSRSASRSTSTGRGGR